MSINRVEWRWVPGYEGLYMVSNRGDVMSLPKPTHYGHVMKQDKIWSGYLRVCLCKDSVKRGFAVHRLVASAFIPNPNGKAEVNHINGDRADNRAENLEWVTRSENERHAYSVLGKKPNAPWKGKARAFARKFTNEQVRAIREDKRPCTEIGREYGVSKTAIRNIKKHLVYREV